MTTKHQPTSDKPAAKPVRRTVRKKPAVRKAKPAAHAEVTAPVASPIHQEAPAAPKTRRQYYYAVGRRKTSVARVRFSKRGEGGILINEKPIERYFPTELLQRTVRSPLEVSGIALGTVTVKVRGGGLHSQAESVRHGIARALLLVDHAVRQPLKAAGFLTRDPRVKERKKYGLKRARRAPQWQKR